MRVAAVVAGVGGETPSAPADIPSGIEPAPASVDVTVVDETCLEPEDRRPLEDPAERDRIAEKNCGRSLKNRRLELLSNIYTQQS